MEKDEGNPATDPDNSVQRLLALSDGVFAIALTLLVLDIQVPDHLDARGLRRVLVDDVLPGLWAYGLSFVIISAFWGEHRRIFLHVRRVDRTVVGIALLGLALVALLPFPTSLLSRYGDRSVAVAVYSATVALMDVVFVMLLVVVWRRDELLSAPISARLRRNYVADLMSTVVVFTLAAPLAFLSTTGAMLFWLCLVPFKVVIGRRGKRLAAETGGP